MGFSSCAKSEEERRNVKIERVVRIYVVEIFVKGGTMLQAGRSGSFPMRGSSFAPSAAWRVLAVAHPHVCS